MRTSALVLLFTLLVCASGCGTIVTGGGHDQAVRIATNPRGADVFVNDNHLGKTPLSIRLTRRDHHFLRVELEGYQTHEQTIRSGLNGWIFGNILLGGIIGLAVDIVSGATTSLSPSNIKLTLVPRIDVPEPQPATSPPPPQ